jgi:hypothetical protein
LTAETTLLVAAGFVITMLVFAADDGRQGWNVAPKKPWPEDGSI